MGFFAKINSFMNSPIVFFKPHPAPKKERKPAKTKAKGTAIALVSPSPLAVFPTGKERFMSWLLSKPLVAQTSAPQAPLSNPMPAAPKQPRDWQEARQQVFEIAARLGITVGQPARGGKTLTYQGQVREFDSWLGAWSALTSGR